MRHDRFVECIRGKNIDITHIIVGCFYRFHSQISENVDGENGLIGVRGTDVIIVNTLVGSRDVLLHNVQNKLDATIARILVNNLLSERDFLLLQKESHVNAMFPTTHEIGKTVFPIEGKNRN